MAKKSQMSDADLLAFIESGKTAEELMKIADINIQTLRRRVAFLSYANKSFYEVKGLYDTGDVVKWKAVGITIPKAKLIDSGFKQGDSFKVSVKGDKITLTKVQ